MAVLSAAQVYSLARSVGLTHEQAIVAAAIAKGESGWRTDAVGDSGLADATWGPSIGLWQVRSLKAQQGTGGTRDAARLQEPAFNARAMAVISGGGSNWTPWTVYTSGAYRRHLAAVRRAVGDGSNVPAPPGVGGDDGADLGDYWDVGQWLLDNPDAVWEAGKGAAGDVVLDAMMSMMRAIAPALLTVTLVGAGFGLIGVGLWRATGRPS